VEGDVIWKLEEHKTFKELYIKYIFSFNLIKARYFYIFKRESERFFEPSRGFVLLDQIRWRGLFAIAKTPSKNKMPNFNNMGNKS
jgi:hypothetical protein